MLSDKLGLRRGREMASGVSVKVTGLEARRGSGSLAMIKQSPFRYFKTSPEIIRLAVMM